MKSEKTQNKRHTRRTVPAILRKRLLEKHNYACVSCGIKNEIVPLELAHIVSVSAGGESTEENLILLCPNCHRLFDRQPREFEFVNFLAELLKLHPKYNDIVQEALLGRETRYRADLIVQKKIRNITEPVIIECKTYITHSSAHINNVIFQLNKYREAYGNSRMVLAVPATLREIDLVALKSAKIEVWDLQYIADEFSEQIQKASFGYYKSLLLAKVFHPAKPTREQELIKALSVCNPGKADWSVFQSLVGDILEFLFTPPLGKPIPELSDKLKANRRDYIMPNYTDNGFWAFMREKYGADYVVIDAKNYVGKVNKAGVLQVANYLKSHGAGLFGLIISRVGGDASGCEHTLREQWLVHRKLILVLDDEDMKEMLIAKSDGRAPEEILGQKIERFRLSM
jgi:hypothetical protein